MRTTGTYTCESCARPFTADRPAVTCSARCRQRRYVERKASDAVRAIAALFVRRIDTGEATSAVVADLRHMVSRPAAEVVAAVRTPA